MTISTPALILVTGPSRSGKSEWAERLAVQTGLAVVYVATAHSDPSDPEWQARIAKHQQRRPPDWKTLSIPVELASTIRAAQPDEVLVVDALGTWLANMLEQDDPAWQDSLAELRQALCARSASVILVAEEVGWGVVPAYPLGRLFRDRLGELTRTVGAIATTVYLVTAGHVLNLSQLGHPLDPSPRSPNENSDP